MGATEHLRGDGRRLAHTLGGGGAAVRGAGLISLFRGRGWEQRGTLEGLWSTGVSVVVFYLLGMGGSTVDGLEHCE